MFDDIENEEEWYRLWKAHDLTSDADFIASTRALAFKLEDDGGWQQAAAIYTHLLPVVHSACGEEDLSSMGIQYDLARFLNKAGKHDEAEALADPLVDLRERIMGPTHQATLNVREVLATCYVRTGKLEEAEAAYTLLLSLYTHQAEPDEASQCRIIGNLSYVGKLYADRGAVESGYQTMIRYVGELRARVDRGDVTLTMLYPYLADICSRLGKYAEAEETLRELLIIEIEQGGGWGTNRNQTCFAISEMGKFYANRKRYPEALAHWKKTETARTEQLDPDHTLTLMAKSHVAGTLAQQGDISAAISVVELIKKSKIRNVESAVNKAEFVKELLETYSYLANLYVEVGRLSDANHLLQEILLNLDGQEPQTALRLESDCCWSLGMILSHQNRLEDARAYRSRALSCYEQLFDPQQMMINAYKVGLSCSLIDLERYEEVEALTKSSVGNVEALIKATAEVEETLRDDAYDMVASLVLMLAYSHYYRLNYADAVPLLNRVLDMKEKTLKQSNSEMLNPLRVLGRCKMNLKEYSVAEALFRRVVAGCEAEWGVGAERTDKSMEELLVLLYEQEKYVEFDKLIKAYYTKGGPWFEVIDDGRKPQGTSGDRLQVDVKEREAEEAMARRRRQVDVDSHDFGLDKTDLARVFRLSKQ
ncbi:MAG: hypothetical protein Q9176_005061 [Flavoplaca citrina]